MDQDQREIRRKRRILEHAQKTGNIIRTCRYFGVSRSTFYLWRGAFQTHGEQGLIRKKPIGPWFNQSKNSTSLCSTNS